MEGLKKTQEVRRGVKKQIKEEKKKNNLKENKV